MEALRGDIAQAGLDTLSGRPAPRARVLLIAGKPGSGRSRLAAEFARQVADDYPDGRLVIVDDVADAEQLDELIPESRDHLVLAVAEGPLTGVSDVRPCVLGGLEPADAKELLEHFAGDIRVTVDPKAAEALVEECEGHPAALTLVGGWLAARPDAAVADAVRALPAGDSALARAFRLTYESLPQPAGHLLRLLALAPAGLVDAHTASALAGCTVAAARTTLEDFERLGLIRRDEELYEVPGCLRPLLQQLLETKERPEEVLLARARMLERTVRLLHSCRAVTEPEDSPVHKRLAGLPKTLRFSSPEAAREWLAGRKPALLAAARSAVADGELDTLARRFAAALSRALAAHQGEESAAPEQYQLHELVLGVAERRGLVREKAAALLNLGDLDARSGRSAEALVRYREALEAAREVGDPQPVGRALESIGCTYQELGDFERAADWYGRALVLVQSRGGDGLVDEARLRGRLGAAHTYAGMWGHALRQWKAASAVCRRLGDRAGQARALGEVARVQEYAGHPRQAVVTCQEALRAALEAGDDRLRAAVQLRLADTLDRLGDPVQAELQRSAAERLLERGAADRITASANGST
ncbi:tetratricopeptide repeat protein [Streptomyces sp. A7024]|uniref:Tetratricopeptide repeat protein n=1 Tax=Streptomyces coryli TaxID=1128680 RepID=A0A6G4U797_9ACTN|nr:tetratricopeptide repeat protein [Streptomyces coryli]NGN68054.1 tetratricopeptide repeat protein [Streptomyces coryli]